MSDADQHIDAKTFPFEAERGQGATGIAAADRMTWYELACPTYSEAAALIEFPLKSWAGQCHGVASLLVDKGIVPGIVRRGYWQGECAVNAYFRSNMAQHSWIELPGGIVCDPTGFAFQLANSGTPDFRTPDPHEKLATFTKDVADVLYDIGGCRTFANAVTDPPDPSTVYESDPVMLDGGAAQYIADLLGADSSFVYRDPDAIEVSNEQAMWLANLPVLDNEGQHNLARYFAAEVYEMLCNAGLRAMIPIDRLDWIAPDLRKDRRP